MAWLTDVHRITTWPGGGWSDVINHVEQLNTAAVIVTGDMTQASEVAAFADFNEINRLTADVYSLPGNHDEGLGLDVSGNVPGQTATFDTYDAAGLMRHFSFDAGAWRFIGFTTTVSRAPAVGRNGIVSTGEKAWVENELQNLDGQIPILLSHYSVLSIIAGGSWNTLAADMITYGVKAFLCGHEHVMTSRLDTGTLEVLGDSIQTGTVGDAILKGGLMLLYVLADRIEIEYQSGRYPYSLYTPATSPAYTTIIVQA